MALAAVGHHRVLPGLTAGDLMFASERVGAKIGRVRSRFRGKPQLPATARTTAHPNIRSLKGREGSGQARPLSGCRMTAAS